MNGMGDKAENPSGSQRAERLSYSDTVGVLDINSPEVISSVEKSMRQHQAIVLVATNGSEPSEELLRSIEHAKQEKVPVFILTGRAGSSSMSEHSEHEAAEAGAVVLRCDNQSGRDMGRLLDIIEGAKSRGSSGEQLRHAVMEEFGSAAISFSEGEDE